MRLAGWAVLWTALVALSTAPVLAQDDGGASEDGNITIVDCSQVINVIQGQYGNVTDVDRKAVVAVANDQDLTINQVNACLGNIGGNGGEETTEEETTEEETTEEETTEEETTEEETTEEETTEEETTEEETIVRDGETIVMPDKLADTTLPDTGGPGGYALAAGCALLGLGLIINRIIR